MSEESNDFIGTATYCPEDNKLRLYPFARLSSEDFTRVKSAGFKWAPKQGLFVAPAWTPNREDMLLDLCGDVADEDMSPEERAADRAERFSEYRDKRRGEAGARADTFENGPEVFGHQNQARAERQANRHDRHRKHALSAWSKAEYWQTRTQGVIANALYKSSPAVRRGRVLKIEAELRKLQKENEEYAARYAGWQKVPTLEGADVVCSEDSATWTPAYRLAYTLANAGGLGWHYKHPRTGKESSIYHHLTDSQDAITAREASQIWLAGKDEPGEEGTNRDRWEKHLTLRIAYELQMIGEEGGLASEREIVPGGFFGRHQVQKVNKSPATGRVVSVGLLAPHHWRKNPDGTPLVLVRSFNIERLSADSYRAPTPEELQAFNEVKTEKKKEQTAKRKENPAPKLINPTLEEAEKLQDLWNKRAKAKYDTKKTSYCKEFDEFRQVIKGTQASYSEASKGTYARYETRTLYADGTLDRVGRSNPSQPICKIRVKQAGGWDAPESVVVLTDKPGKPLGLDWQAIEAPETVTA